MTIQAAALWGNAIGLVLRTVWPFLLEVWKGKKKWDDWDWHYLQPMLYALIPAAGTSVGVPMWLESYHVPPEHPLFVPLVFAGCIATAYLGQDLTRESMRPRRQVETPKPPEDKP